MQSRNTTRTKRQNRIRGRVSGTEVRPRVSVYKSRLGVYAQIVDDTQSKTIVSVQYKEVLDASPKNDVKRAFALGKLLAQKCAQKKITAVVFDRGGYKYHGKIKALADGARQGGLRF